ncbi:MAG: hypothetical protein K2N01_07985 [Lachnospiraceae bacterium]|nr:hypothetical protein [Lachnospiraceae bacterium]
MSAKTKIVVLRMKELVYTGIFAVLGILLVLLLIYMFAPKKEEASEETMKYVAGVYTSSIVFQDRTVDVEVVVDENAIKSISLVNLDETVTAMYPLMEPALEQLTEQILETQSTENLTYSDDNQYTSMVLLRAIDQALEKAEIPAEE